MAVEREGTIGPRRAVETVFAEDHARIMAILVRDLGDYDLAEDGLQEAFGEALRTWPTRGVPRNPSAWIVTTARNRAIDRLRRAANGDTKYRLVASATSALTDFDTLVEDDDLPDERLRLIFTGCHPAIARSDSVALVLRTVCGLTTRDLASVFVVKETTMQARITRAKAKIRDARIPYRVPEHHELPERLPTVLDVVSLIYNQGYTPPGDAPLVDDLRRRAIGLAEVLAAHLPDEPEALGLLALLLFHETRQPGRVDDDGELVALADQDRGRWNRALADRAEPLLEQALRRGRPGPYQLQAAISALHSTADRAEDTDWDQIVLLYDHLLAAAPSPITAIGRAVAVGMSVDPEAGLVALPPAEPQLVRFHRWHAARADLLARAGRHEEAAEAYRTAADLAPNLAERRWLERRAAGLSTR